MDRFQIASMTVDKVMTKNLITISIGKSVEEAVRKMIEHDIECLPVIDSEGVLHGLITFRDIVTKAVLSNKDVKTLKVEDIMTKNLVTCTSNSTILEVVKIMKNKHLRRIPIVDSSNKLVGLVTDFDLTIIGWEI
ncbi:MAG: CBS domain-containing protein [Aigarchaeota archaeon]|nr:CBS domain-containing protein [Aigarchaeota archaeon]MCX8193034.1 CBS domain-containing protein [Nitrososphaeria archaeon]MDW7986230.1 CBS domain-containing protein [Nitrososphaerota archaeon]